MAVLAAEQFGSFHSGAHDPASRNVEQVMWERSHKPCAESKKPAPRSHALEEMTNIVRSAAEPAVPGERVGAAIRRASRCLNLPYSRTRDYWYGRVRMVPVEEADHLRATREQLLRDRLRRNADESALLRARLGDLA